MKKVLFATLFAAGASLLMTSCDNKDYDADPNVDLSQTKNPLNSNGEVNVYPGTIEVRLNYADSLIFTPATISTDTDGNRLANATSYNKLTREHDSRRLFLFIPNDSYKGKNDYNIGADTLGWYFSFTYYDTVNAQYRNYIASTAFGKGIINLKVKGDEGGHLRGTFSGTVYRVFQDGTKSDNDSMVFSNGEFYFLKK